MHNFRFALRCSLLYLLLGFFSLSFAYTHPSWGNAPWSKDYFVNIEKSHGATVAKRARRLESIILSNATRSDEEKLKAVNQFFNEVEYVPDILHWGKRDYWQTPLETLIEFKGDCEDIAIAKYAALRAMGVPDEKLALVNARMNGEPHMLLAFFQASNPDPLILDNTTDKIIKASVRAGLIPVYGFNSSSLWLLDRQMHKQGKRLPLPSSHRLRLS